MLCEILLMRHSLCSCTRATLGSYYFFQVFEGFVGFRLFLIALARLYVAVFAAHGAEPFTAIRAYWNKRKMQDYFLPHHLT